MHVPERGQSVQIGALLLFAFLVVGLSLMQATLVPDENAEVEFNHNQAVQDDLVDLRSNLLRSAVTGESRTSSVKLGTRYPSRSLLLNPGAPAGSLRTTPAGTIDIENARATDDEVADYLDGSTVSFPTTAVVYEPSYNEFGGAPTTRFQASVLVNEYDDEARVRSDQTFISGRTLTFVPVVGEFSAARVGSASVEPTVVSEVERTVTVESDGDPISLSLETRLSEDRWRDLLSDELGSSGTVQSIDCPGAASDTDPCGTLVVTLEPDTEYELRLGEVAMGSLSASVSDDADPQYVVPVAGDGATVTEGNTRTVTLEVRDQFNNPVSGVTLRATQPQAGSVTNGSETNTDGTVTAVTNENGRVSLTYRAPLNVDEDRPTEFQVSIDSPPSDVTAAQARTTLALTAEDGSETVDDRNWPHPLVDAVQPTPQSSHTEFVRVHFPSGVTDPSAWSLTDGEATTPLPADADSYTGEHYFVVSDSDFSSEHGSVPESRIHDLGDIELESSDSVRLVRYGRTVDAFGYEGETVDARPTAAGWSYDFDDTGAPEGIVAERRIEDGAYVDRNGSADWRSVPESDLFGEGEPTVGSLSASVDYGGQSGPGGSGGPTSGQVSFSFAFDDEDDEVSHVDVEATYRDTGEGTTEVESATVDSKSGSTTLVFSENYRMDGDDQFVEVRIEVDDGEGNTVIYTGEIQSAGQTVTFAGEGIE